MPGAKKKPRRGKPRPPPAAERRETKRVKQTQPGPAAVKRGESIVSELSSLLRMGQDMQAGSSGGEPVPGARTTKPNRVGRAASQSKRPTMTVWTPPGTTPLSFDAGELEGFLVDERKGKRVRNPALVLGGVPDETRRLLAPTLDDDTVTSLSVQARLTAEGADAALEKTPLEARELDLLHQVIVPAMVHHLEQHRYVQAVARLYRTHVPEAVQRLVGKAGQAARFVFEHPLLRTFALLLGRVLRTYMCMATFGLTGRDWDNLRISLLRAIDPRNHYDFLRLLVEGLCVVMQCLTLNTTDCIWGATQNTLKTLGWAYNLFHSVCGYALSFVYPLRVIFDYVPRVNLFPGEEGSLAGWISKALYQTVGVVTDREQLETELHLRAAVDMASPFWRDMQALYMAPVHRLAWALVLWLLRNVESEDFLRWLKDTTEVCQWLTPAYAPLASALRGLPEGTRDAVLTALRTLRHVQALRQVQALMALWADLVHCLAIYVQRQVGLLMGISAAGSQNNASCCGRELRATFTSILERRDQQLRELELRQAEAPVTHEGHQRAPRRKPRSKRKSPRPKKERGRGR